MGLIIMIVLPILILVILFIYSTLVISSRIDQEEEKYMKNQNSK